MIFIKQPKSRRAFLSQAAKGVSVAALLPLVPSLEAFAAPAAGIPKRFAYWYYGTLPLTQILRDAYPASASNFVFRKSFEVLNPVAKYLVLPRGLKNQAHYWKDPAQGKPINVGFHPRGGLNMWTGRGFEQELKPTIYENGVRSNDGSVLYAGLGPQANSIDQALSKALVGQSPFPDIRVGVNNKPDKDGEVSRSISVRDGALMPRHQSPLSLYNEIFKGFTPSTGGQPVVNTLLVQRKSVLDFTLDSMRALKSQVSAADVQRLAQHEAAIEEVEKTIVQQMEGGVGSGNCTLPANLMAMADSTSSEQTTPAVYAKMIALAFACRLTRVAGGFFGAHTSTCSYGWVKNSLNTGFHSATHNSGAAVEAFMHGVLEHRMQTFRSLIDELAAQKEADGTSLLEHTMAVTFGDTGGSHDPEDVLCLIASGSKKFSTGKMTSVANGTTNQVLHTVGTFMGFPNLNVGNPQIETKMLPTTIFAP
jgi:Protein of unknown function (DUF1552)